MEDYSDSISDSIKGGAELLLKGASLLKEPCEICNGVQLDYKNKIICVNCNKEIQKSNESTNLKKENKIENRFEQKDTLEKKTFQDSIDFLQIKIINSIEKLKIDDDYFIQKTRLDLIESYLRILKELTNF